MLRPVPIDSEPKRKNRWVLEFPAELGFSEWMVQATSRPHYMVDSVPIPFMNTETYVAGRFKWNNIGITFIDPIGPSATQKVMEWVRQCSESATGRMGYATQYKKNLVLKMLDPAGQTVEKWVLYGAFVTDAQFGNLEYGSSDLADIQVNIQYDRAILEF